MIEKIRGELIEKSPTSIVVDCGGVGYGLRVTLPTFEALGEVGTPVELYTYLQVREDVLQLFGFSSRLEREVFLMLTSVSKIGPKTAQATLSGISVANFVQAIRSENVAALTKIPGIGRQTAERLIVELKGKVDKLGLVSGEMASGEARKAFSVGKPYEEAVLALEELGYKRPYAERAVARVAEERGRDLPVEEIIKFALKYI
jgi:holliday junction DNA helicase RuvA